VVFNQKSIVKVPVPKLKSAEVPEVNESEEPGK